MTTRTQRTARTLPTLAPRTAAIAIAALALIAAIQIYTAWMHLRGYGLDLQQDYIAAQRLLAGESLFTRFTTDEVRALDLTSGLGKGIRQNAHPPFAIVLTVPFTLLPFAAAALLWTILSAAALMLAAWLIIEELALPIYGALRTIALLSLISWYPMWFHLPLGQWTALLLLLFVAAWWCLRRGYDTWAGVLIAVAALIKIYPLLLFGFALWRGRWRVLAAGAAVGFGAVLLHTSIAPAHYIEFVTQVVTATDAKWRSHLGNGSLSAISVRLFVGGPSFPPLFPFPAAELPARAVIHGLGAVVFAAAFWRARPRRDLTGELAALVCALTLFSPLSWPHVMLLVLLPLGYVWARTREVGFKNLRVPATLALAAFALSWYPESVILSRIHQSYAPAPMPLWMNFHAHGLIVFLLTAAATLLALVSNAGAASGTEQPASGN